MEIKVKRIAKNPEYTIGKLYLNGEYFCDTLEDTDRGLKDSDSLSDITMKKVKGETAIPTGTYMIEITYSPKFNRDLPLLKYVKGFEGIRIHSGNDKKDTEGCILVGFNKEKGKVLDSRKTLDKLMSQLTSNTTITII